MYNGKKQNGGAQQSFTGKTFSVIIYNPANF